MASEALPLVPGYTILSELGRGGMARVYLAREERLRRLVALKVIAEHFDASDEFRRRFEREARTAAGLSHPNIVPVYAYGVTEAGSPYISMAFLDGGNLRERLRKHGPMRVDEALPMIRQVASALQAAHARNVVHRDLKPDNVMFQGENTLLTDFGIAKVLDATTSLTGTGVNPGTVSYFSPEQARGEALDQRSDIYTLGVVLYEMLTGRLPIEAPSYSAFIHRILVVAPAALPTELAGLQPFLDRLLCKDPADRLHTCGEVTAIIDAMMSNWARHGSVDRVSDGVDMRRSGQQAAQRDLDGANAADNVDNNSAAGIDASTALMPATRTEQSIAAGVVATPAPAISGTDAQRTGLLRIDVTPSDALVTVDYTDPNGDERSELWRGRALRLPIGELRIGARATGYRDVNRRVRLQAGERDEVLELEPIVESLTATIAMAKGDTVSEQQIDPARAARPTSQEQMPADPPRTATMKLALGAVAALAIAAGVWMITNLGGESRPEVHTSTTAEPQALAAADAAPPTAAPNPAIPLQGNAIDPVRAELLARVAGRWAFVGSSDCADFSIAGDTLVQRWPGIEEAREHVDFVYARVVQTTVETPAGQRGQRFEYTPITPGRLEVHDVKSGRRDELRTCVEVN